jgi:thiol-disulfide isomerase/thioredoxin
MELIIFTLLIIFFLYYYITEKFNNDNKYLVLYHTNWCGYCKKFIPIWNELKNDEKLKNIIFIDVDMSDNNNKKINNDKIEVDILNKIKNIEINGFPTIKLFYKGEIINYENNREKDEIIKFINSHN